MLKEVERIALYDVRKLFDGDGSLIALSEIDDDTAAVVAGITVTECDGNKRVRVLLADKLRALEMLTRHLGLYRSDHRAGSDPMAELREFISSRQSQRLPIAADANGPAST